MQTTAHYCNTLRRADRPARFGARVAALRLGVRVAALAAWLAVALVCLPAFAGGAPPDEAQKEPNANERRVKARFLFRFAGYVDWPENAFRRADSPVTLGVLGDDPLAEELSRLVAGHRVDGRRLVVRRVDLAEQASGVHVLFVGRAAPGMRQIMRVLPAHPMLVVSETQGALNHGSVINFILVDGRVRFEISQAAAQRRGIKLSSRLLNVAHSVRKGTP